MPAMQHPWGNALPGRVRTWPNTRGADAGDLGQVYALFTAMRQARLPGVVGELQVDGQRRWGVGLGRAQVLTKRRAPSCSPIVRPNAPCLASIPRLLQRGTAFRGRPGPPACGKRGQSHRWSCRPCWAGASRSIATAIASVVQMGCVEQRKIACQHRLVQRCETGMHGNCWRTICKIG